jgi:hypothetical protein
MSKVVINVYKNDDSFVKTPSLLQFEVDEKEGWRNEVETTLIKLLTHKREDYTLAYHYTPRSQPKNSH